MNGKHEPLVIGIWTEWRCNKCGKLQMKHVLPLGGIIETKCWNCKQWLRLEVPFIPPDEEEEAR